MKLPDGTTVVIMSPLAVNPFHDASILTSNLFRPYPSGCGLLIQRAFRLCCNLLDEGDNRPTHLWVADTSVSGHQRKSVRGS